MKAVHHIDGDPHNNTPSNIRIVDFETNSITRRAFVPTDTLMSDALRRNAPFLFGIAVGAKWVQQYRSKGRNRGKRLKWVRVR